MSNGIAERQNEPQMIENKAATREAYASGKALGEWQTRLAIVSAVGVPALVAVAPAAQVWGAVYSVATLIADVVFFEPAVKARQRIGAKVQEVFDTYVLAIPWNETRAGPRPEPETVAEFAAKFRRKKANDAAKLRDWYPAEVDCIPIGYARFICQRSNMRWDAALRRKYCSLFVALLFAMLVGGLAFGAWMNWETDKFITSILLPVLPAGIKIYRECGKHRESASATDEARAHLERYWRRAVENEVSAEGLLRDARHLQDELFDRRRAAPSVPEWLYDFYRDDFEGQMKAAAADMIGQAERKAAAAAEPQGNTAR